jgi:hypothetical protein
MKDVEISVIEQPQVAERLRSAFPRDLTVDVDMALGLMPLGKLAPSSQDIGSVVVRGESVQIPCRLYSPEPSDAKAGLLKGKARVIMACLYSRHHDGYVRERYARELLLTDQPWVPPFVLQLVGEYVMEIIELVANHSDRLKTENYRLFAAENPEFIQKTRHRVISYWNCYYHSEFPALKSYPGFRLMSELGLWDSHDGHRYLAR